MKGIIFTEFLDMVEERFSIETAEEILEAANLASGGSYTTQLIPTLKYWTLSLTWAK